jgi:hypothetical protein
MSPPQAVKDKHVRLRVSGGRNGSEISMSAAAAQDFTPRCHPDAASIPKREHDLASSSATTTQTSSSSSSSWRDNISFKAMGWRMKESCDRLQLLAGDRLDIAYSLGMNDHPEFGGLELSLKDVVRTR